MKEIDNVQVPIKMDIRDILNKYGSHYTVKISRQKDAVRFRPVPFILSINEEVGPKDKYNDWKHQFATLEEAKQSLYNTMEINRKEILESYEKRDSTFSWKLHKFFAKLGFLDQRAKDTLAEHANFMTQLRSDIEAIKNKETAVEINRMEGSYNVPLYIPEVGKTYYMLNLNDFSNIKLTPMTLIPEEISIYDYRGSRSNDSLADQFDFRFSHYFEGPNGENTSLDSERLFRFNGQYWELGVYHYYLFVDEKEALAFAKKCAENKVVTMQRELEAIAESMTKL